MAVLLCRRGYLWLRILKTWDKPIYTFLSQCQEEPSRYLEDECWTIIVYADCDTSGLSEELKTFLEYVRTGRLSNKNAGLAGRLDAAVARAKQRTEWGVEYMKWEHEVAAILREGREEGRIMQAVDIYRNEMKMGDPAILDKIMTAFHLTKQQAEEYVLSAEKQI